MTSIGDNELDARREQGPKPIKERPVSRLYENDEDWRAKDDDPLDLDNIATHKDPDLDTEDTLSLLERADAFRRPDRLDRLLEIADCDAHGDAAARTPAPREQLRIALEAARKVDAGAIAHANPQDIGAAVRRARLVAIAALQPSTGN